MLRIDFKLAKTMFFDQAEIKRKVDARTRQVLSKFGAFVRQTSRRENRSVNERGRPSRGVRLSVTPASSSGSSISATTATGAAS